MKPRTGKSHSTGHKPFFVSTNRSSGGDQPAMAGRSTLSYPTLTSTSINDRREQHCRSDHQYERVILSPVSESYHFDN